MKNKTLGNVFNIIDEQIKSGMESLGDAQVALKTMKDIVELKEKNNQPEKSNEELIYELLKDDLKDWYHTEEDNYIPKMKDFKNTVDTVKNKLCKSQFFVIVLKGAHELIEGDKKNRNKWYIEFDTPKQNYDVSYDDYKINFPSFFYFSSTENAEKARGILSKFFGVNLLDWWYKS